MRSDAGAGRGAGGEGESRREMPRRGMSLFVTKNEPFGFWTEWLNWQKRLDQEEWPHAARRATCLHIQPTIASDDVPMVDDFAAVNDVNLFVQRRGGADVPRNGE